MFPGSNVFSIVSTSNIFFTSVSEGNQNFVGKEMQRIGKSLAMLQSDSSERDMGTHVMGVLQLICLQVISLLNGPNECNCQRFPQFICVCWGVGMELRLHFLSVPFHSAFLFMPLFLTWGYITVDRTSLNNIQKQLVSTTGIMKFAQDHILKCRIYILVMWIFKLITLIISLLHPFASHTSIVSFMRGISLHEN